jgi:hypothetical protein
MGNTGCNCVAEKQVNDESIHVEESEIKPVQQPSDAVAAHMTKEPSPRQSIEEPEVRESPAAILTAKSRMHDFVWETGDKGSVNLGTPESVDTNAIYRGRRNSEG